MLLGARLDVRALEVHEPIARSPVVIRVQQDGFAVLFRYGAVVLFNMGDAESESFVRSIKPFVGEPVDRPETEQAELRLCEADKEERAALGVFHLRDMGVERLQLVAEVLAKSVVLAHYERTISAVFDHIEPLAIELERSGRSRRRVPAIMRDIGNALLIQHRMVGRAEVGEKPDVLWEHPELELLYARLADEYEVRERQVALERKLNLVSVTASTLVDLLQQNRSHRLEWYILMLIVAELVISLLEKIT